MWMDGWMEWWVIELETKFLVWACCVSVGPRKRRSIHLHSPGNIPCFHQYSPFARDGAMVYLRRVGGDFTFCIISQLFSWESSIGASFQVSHFFLLVCSLSSKSGLQTLSTLYRNYSDVTDVLHKKHCRHKKHLTISQVNICVGVKTGWCNSVLISLDLHSHGINRLTLSAYRNS